MSLLPAVGHHGIAAAPVQAGAPALPHGTRRTRAFPTWALKVVLAGTGVVLTLFVLAHSFGNLEVFTGAEHLNGYAHQQDGEAVRDDEHWAFVSAWQAPGNQRFVRHHEVLAFDAVPFRTRDDR